MKYVALPREGLFFYLGRIVSDYSWRKICEDIAVELIMDYGSNVEYLSIVELVDDRLGNPNDLTFDPYAYVVYLIDNAEVEITFPKERLRSGESAPSRAIRSPTKVLPLRVTELTTPILEFFKELKRTSRVFHKGAISDTEV